MDQINRKYADHFGKFDHGLKKMPIEERYSSRSLAIMEQVLNLQKSAENGDVLALNDLHTLATFSTDALERIWKKQPAMVQKFSCACERWSLLWTNVPFDERKRDAYKDALERSLNSDPKSLIIRRKAFRTKSFDDPEMPKDIATKIFALTDAVWQVIDLEKASDPIGAYAVELSMKKLLVESCLDDLHRTCGTEKSVDDEVLSLIRNNLQSVTSFNNHARKFWGKMAADVFRVLTKNRPEEIELFKKMVGKSASNDTAGRRRDYIIKQIKDATERLRPPDADSQNPI